MHQCIMELTYRCHDDGRDVIRVVGMIIVACLQPVGGIVGKLHHGRVVTIGRSLHR